MANDKLDPLRDIGVPVDSLPDKLRKALEELDPDEVRVLAKIQKRAVDLGVGTLAPIGGGAGGGTGSCLY